MHKWSEILSPAAMAKAKKTTAAGQSGIKRRRHYLPT